MVPCLFSRATRKSPPSRLTIDSWPALGRRLISKSLKVQPTQRGQKLWDEGQRVDVAGAHDGEVPAVQSCQLNDPETFCQGDETRVGRAERHVGVMLYQFGAAAQVGRSEVDHGQEAGSERA
jgi:hypothetical protein